MAGIIKGLRFDSSTGPRMGAVILTNQFSTVGDRILHETGVADGMVGIAPGTYKPFTNGAKDVIRTVADTFATRFVQDTSLGGNEAINPLWGFCINDDIVPDEYRNSKGGRRNGMGRMYHNMYGATASYLHIICGSPHYSGMVDYFTETRSGEATNVLFGSDDQTIFSLLGKLLTKTGRLLVSIPFLPIKGFVALVSLANEFKLNKYVTFVPNMGVYYRMVNTFMHMLAAGLGLGELGSIDAIIGTNETGGVQEGDLRALYEEMGMPAIMRNRLDIVKLLGRRFRRKDDLPDEDIDSDVLIQAQHTDSGLYGVLQRVVSYLSGIKTTFVESVRTTAGVARDAMLSGYQYVTFRVTNDNASENFSNSIGESNLAGKLNSNSTTSLERRFSTNGYKTGIGVIDWLGEQASELVDALTDATGLSGIKEMKIGSGFYDIPEIWKGSQFSKSYTFDLQLRAPLGDPASIFQSIYVPLALLICAAAPRQSGSNLYTSPFVIRAYCKGQFACPYGMIENLQITRAPGSRAWTYGKLPLAVDVSFTIRDMSPALCIGMGGSGLFGTLFEQNVNQAEYIATLSGIGFKERFDYIPQMRRALKGKLADLASNLSPTYWAQRFGTSGIGQTIGNLAYFFGVPKFNKSVISTR